MKAVSILFALALFLSAQPAAAQPQNGVGYVCAEIDTETNECLSWREVVPTPEGQIPVYVPYADDYLLPPGHARAPKRLENPGSGLMPGREYAPGIGTSHKPIFENK